MRHGWMKSCTRLAEGKSTHDLKRRAAQRLSQLISPNVLGGGVEVCSLYFRACLNMEFEVLKTG